MAEQPKYLQVADTLRKEIAEGKFRDGQTLMTEEELRFRFNVSRQTVRQAIALLEDDGLVDRRRGSGTYVRHGPRKRQGTVHVGVVTTYITDYIFPSIVQGMESVLNANGAVMNLSATYNDSKTERNILERMLDGQVDGLIVEGARTAQGNENEDLYRRLAERNIPVLFMNSYYPGTLNMPHVVMDDYGGGRIAAREMLSRGYRRPGGMFKVDDLQGKERLKGFLDEMQSQGMAIPDELLHIREVCLLHLPAHALVEARVEEVQTKLLHLFRRVLVEPVEPVEPVTLVVAVMPYSEITADYDKIILCHFLLLRELLIAEF